MRWRRVRSAIATLGPQSTRTGRLAPPQPPVRLADDPSPSAAAPMLAPFVAERVRQRRIEATARRAVTADSAPS
jgi:hypothetical protein